MKVLYILFALEYFTSALYFPVSAVHVINLGASNFQIGLINSAAALISLLWNPIIGSLSDLKGRRGLLVMCMAAALVGNMLMGITSSLAIAFVGRLLTAFGGPTVILLNTVITDVCESKEEENEFFQRSMIIASAIFMLGSIISGFISDLHNGIFYVFLLMSMNLVVEIAYSLPNDAKSKKIEGFNGSVLQTGAKELKQAVMNIKNLDWSEYWDIFLVKAGVDFGTGISLATIGLVLVNSYKLTGSQIGSYFTLTSIFRIIAYVLIAKYKSKANFQQIFYASIIIFTCYVSFGIETNIYFFSIVSVVLCMAGSFIGMTLMEYVTSKTQEHDKGKVISAFESMFPLAMFLCPLITGFMADRIGERLTSGLAAIPAAVATVVAFSRRKLKSE